MLIEGDYFENIFNTVRNAIIVLDENKKVLSANRSFYIIFKVNPANTIGTLLYDLGNGQWNIPALRLLIEDILPKNTTVENFIVEHKFQSIGHKIMLLNASRIREKEDDSPIILLAIEDITEHRRLEDLLAESELRYRRIFETASDGIVLLEKSEGTIMHTNPAAQRMLGYSKDECKGKKLQDIGVSIDLTDFSAIKRELEKSGIINYEDIPVKSRSGQHIVTDIYIVDRATLAQCNIRDVTERNQAKKDLDIVTQRLALATQSAKLGIWDLDLKKNVLIWDKRMYELYGIRPEDFGGAYEAWEKGVHPEDLVAVRAEVQDAITKTGTFCSQFRVVWPNGEVHHIEAYAIVQKSPDGTPLRMIGVNWDITERKKLEEQLRHAQKMEAVGTLAGGYRA